MTKLIMKKANMTNLKCFILILLTALSLSSAKAQKQSFINLDVLIPNDLGSPFDIPLAELQKQNRDMESKIDRAVDEIADEERNLFEKKKYLEQQGYDAEGFMHEFNARMSAVPETELEHLDRGTPITRDFVHESSIEFKQLHNLVNVGIYLAGNFIDDFEAYDRHSQDLELAVAMKFLRLEIENLRTNPIEGPGLGRLKNSYQKILEYKDSFKANKNQYGQAKDILRVTPFNKFIATVRSTIADIHRFEELGPDKKPNPIVKSILKGLSQITTVALPPVAEVLKRTLLTRDPNEKTVPLTQFINSGARLLGKVKGEKVKVIGRENLPVLDEQDTVNFILFNHGDGAVDMHAMAHLRIDKMVLFVAAGNFLPDSVAPKLIEALNNNKGIVVVGSRNNPNKIDPTEKLQKIIEETSVRTVVVLPQGMRPARGNAASPVRDGAFQMEGPIRLLEKTKKVNIVSMTTDYYRPYGLDAGNSDPTVVVRIHPTIPDAVRRRFMALGGDQAMPILLQYGLLGNLRTSTLPNGEVDPNGDLFWGKVRASNLNRILPRYLKTSEEVSNHEKYRTLAPQCDVVLGLSKAPTISK